MGERGREKGREREREKERNNTNAKNFDFSNEAHSCAVPILRVIRARGQLDRHQSITVLLVVVTVAPFCRRHIEIIFHDRLSTHDTIMTASGSDGTQGPTSLDKRYRRSIVRQPDR
jgi:hypothetical protein